MTADYFYKKLLWYKDEVVKTSKECSNYRSGMVTIHKIGDLDITCYTINYLGAVLCEDIKSGRKILMKLSDLTGNDFELYSTVQVFKCGYIILKDTKNIQTVKRHLTDLYNRIENMDSTNYNGDISLKPLMYNKGAADILGMLFCLKYQDTNGIEVNIFTLDELQRLNDARKYYGAKKFPTSNKIKPECALYITFTDNVTSKYTAMRYQEAVTKLLYLFNDTELVKKYLVVDMNSPVYI